jgi:hypothetical protein
MRLRSHALWCLTVVLTGFAAQPAAQERPTLEAILARAGEYVLQLQAALSGLVAEEHYTQDLDGGIRRSEHRDLKSDLLLIRPEGADRYIQFRDVFEVDGRPVRDRDDRLVTLFLHPAPSAVDQLQAIADESARYNIGDGSRTVNVPVLALMVLQPNNQTRFKFTMVKTGASVYVPWEIDYREVQPETLIRTTASRDLPAHGRFRIEPLSGRVWMSELVTEDATVRGDVTVTYQWEPALAVLVPVEMRESIWMPQGSTDIKIKGKATYSRFRRFQVSVEESLAPVKP